MGKMNLGRVILGGLVAGVIIDACEFVINAVILKQAWADAIGSTLPEETLITRVFSGRAGRSVATDLARAAAAPGAPPPAPYPVQAGLTLALRTRALRTNRLDGLAAWAGQSAARAQARPAADVARDLWRGARALLEPA